MTVGCGQYNCINADVRERFSDNAKDTYSLLDFVDFAMCQSSFRSESLCYSLQLFILLLFRSVGSVAE